MQGAPSVAVGAKSDDSKGLTRTAGRGALWQLAGGAWETIVRVGASTVLARVLDPTDFGIMGMAMLVQGFVGRMAAFGTGAGVIAKKDITQQDVSTAFWMSALVYAFMFVIAFSAAPYAAAFFTTPEIEWVLRVVAISFLFNAASSMSGTLLRKELRFGTLKTIECGGIVIQSGVAIVLAGVFQMGYWALVIGLVAANLASTVARIACAAWLPSIAFSGKSFRYMFRYGINNLGSTFVSYCHANVDYLLVGRILGPATLGLYEFAFRIPHMISDRAARPVGAVLFPTLSKLQANDERLAAAYIKTAKYIALIVLPALFGLSAVARPAVLVLWGAKWLPIVIPLQILCLRAAAVSVLSPVGSLFLCKNRPDVPFKFSLCTLLVTCSAVALLGYLYGLIGVASGMAISLIPHIFLAWLAFRMLRHPFPKLLKSLKPAGISSVISSVLAFLAANTLESGNLPCGVVLPIAVAAGMFSYAAALRLLFPETLTDVQETARLVMSRKMNF